MANTKNRKARATSARQQARPAADTAASKEVAMALEHSEAAGAEETATSADPADAAGSDSAGSDSLSEERLEASPAGAEGGEEGPQPPRLHAVEDVAVEDVQDDDASDVSPLQESDEFDGVDSGRGVELAGEGLDPQEGEAENTEEFLKGLVEAILFTADHPLSVRDVARAARIDRHRAQELIEMLATETRNRGVRVIEVADGFAFRTNPAYGNPVRDFLAQKPVRLSRAQLETLAIIAYRQPVTRPEVDDIRGVDSGAVLKALLERDLLRILGKKDEPGRPMIYGTTPQFLDLFSLKSLRDLPTLREFTELSEDSRAKFELELGEAAPEGPIDLGSSEPPADGEGEASPEGDEPGLAEGTDAPAEPTSADADTDLGDQDEPGVPSDPDEEDDSDDDDDESDDDESDDDDDESDDDDDDDDESDDDESDDDDDDDDEPEEDKGRA